MKPRLTRRDFFTMFTRPFQPVAETQPAKTGLQQVAIVQGRHCLALTSFCAACVERCPVPGAMEVSRGMPMVNPDLCTGCGICQQVCPAPVNAVLVLPRRPRPTLA